MVQALAFGVDVGIYGRLATRDHILELAELAESAGLESLWVADHVIFPSTVASTYPYSATGAFPVDMRQEPLLEPMATMGVLVGATRRVTIGTAVLVMPYRNPVLLGRMLVTLDVLSGGRTMLGAGVGWLAEEFAGESPTVRRTSWDSTPQRIPNTLRTSTPRCSNSLAWTH